MDQGLVWGGVENFVGDSWHVVLDGGLDPPQQAEEDSMPLSPNYFGHKLIVISLLQYGVLYCAVPDVPSSRHSVVILTEMDGRLLESVCDIFYHFVFFAF